MNTKHMSPFAAALALPLLAWSATAWAAPSTTQDAAVFDRKSKADDAISTACENAWGWCNGIVSDGEMFFSCGCDNATNESILEPAADHGVSDQASFDAFCTQHIAQTCVEFYQDSATCSSNWGECSVKAAENGDGYQRNVDCVCYGSTEHSYSDRPTSELTLEELNNECEVELQACQDGDGAGASGYPLDPAGEENRAASCSNDWGFCKVATADSVDYVSCYCEHGRHEENQGSFGWSSKTGSELVGECFERVTVCEDGDDGDDDDDDDDDDSGEHGNENWLEDLTEAWGCTVAPGSGNGWASFAILGLAALLRRRR